MLKECRKVRDEADDSAGEQPRQPTSGEAAPAFDPPELRRLYHAACRHAPHHVAFVFRSRVVGEGVEGGRRELEGGEGFEFGHAVKVLSREVGGLFLGCWVEEAWGGHCNG